MASERGEMELVQKLQNRFGSRWTKVKFYETSFQGEGVFPAHGDRFCQAIVESYRRRLVATPQSITCPGAQHVFGWNQTSQREMVTNFCNELGFSQKQAETIIAQIPKLPKGCAAIGLNQKDDPDVFVSYLQPQQVMTLVNAYQQKTGEELKMGLASVASICGHGVVKAFLRQEIAFSFGCPNARKYGEVSRDRLAVAVPFELATILTS